MKIDVICLGNPCDESLRLIELLRNQASGHNGHLGVTWAPTVAALARIVKRLNRHDTVCDLIVLPVAALTPQLTAPLLALRDTAVAIDPNMLFLYLAEEPCLPPFIADAHAAHQAPYMIGTTLNVVPKIIRRHRRIHDHDGLPA